MNIAENILKYNLKNVYFLIGSLCGGKTTMCQALAGKYGFTYFNSNHRQDDFMNWRGICDPAYQKVSTQKTTDWEYFFNRPPEAYHAWLYASMSEYFEYGIIEIIKLAQANTVVTDIYVPMDIVTQIAPPNRVACMLTTPELVIQDFYQREDHRDIYECIMSLRNPEQTLENYNVTLKKECRGVADEAYQKGLFTVMRDENSTVEKTLRILEKHFGLA